MNTYENLLRMALEPLRNRGEMFDADQEKVFSSSKSVLAALSRENLFDDDKSFKMMQACETRVSQV